MKKIFNKFLINFIAIVFSALFCIGVVLASNVFPKALNNYSTGDVITADAWNALEAKIGADNSTVTSSLDYLIKNPNSILGSIYNITPTDGVFIVGDGSKFVGESGATARTSIGLGNVENTALSTWAGSSNLTTLGTITSGVWNGTPISDAYVNNDITLDNITQITNRSINDTTGILSNTKGGTGQDTSGWSGLIRLNAGQWATTTLTDSDIPDTITASNYLPLAGGTMTGALTVNGLTTLATTTITDLTVSNVFHLNGTVQDDINMNNGLITNIGNTGTDFTSGGGLILAGTLTADGQFVVNGTSTLATTTATDLTVSGGITANSFTTGLTAGSVLFAGTGGLVSQDNSNLFWDNTNKRLGIGTASPSYALDVSSTQGVFLGSILGDYQIDSNGNLSASDAIYQPIYGSDDGLILDLPFSEKISDEMLADNSFETSTVFTDWTKFGEVSGSYEISTTTADSYSGSQSILLKQTTTTASDFGVSQSVPVSSATIYQVNAWVKIAQLATTTDGVVLEADGDVSGFLNSQTYETVGSWKFISLRITTGASDANVTIKAYLSGQNGTSTAYIDLVSLKKADTSLAHDYSPYANDATIYGASFGEGKDGQDIQLDGVNDYAQVTNFMINDFDEQTISFWFKLEKLDASLVSYNGRTTISVLSDGRIKIELQGRPNGARIYSVGAVNTGEWHHLTIYLTQRDRNASRTIDDADIWIDGVLQDKTIAFVGANSDIYTTLNIGCYQPGIEQTDGEIDELHIYNRKLSSQEIKAQYLQGLKTHSIVQTDVWRLLNMDNNTLFKVDTSDSVSTTVYIGDSTHSGCLVIGDSDNGGLTYCTALNGTLSCTTTKPAICK